MEKQWKQAAFSQYPRMDVAGNYVMGYTMRTKKYVTFVFINPWKLFNCFIIESYSSCISKNLKVMVNASVLQKHIMTLQFDSLTVNL